MTGISTQWRFLSWSISMWAVPTHVRIHNIKLLRSAPPQSNAIVVVQPVVQLPMSRWSPRGLALLPALKQRSVRDLIEKEVRNIQRKNLYQINPRRRVSNLPSPTHRHHILRLQKYCRSTVLIIRSGDVRIVFSACLANAIPTDKRDALKQLLRILPSTS